MSGHRQAAVALHALVEADRASILAELPAQDQVVLRGYLNELDELGFDSNASAEALPPRTHAGAPVGGAANDAPVDALEAASAASIHTVLEGEPATLVAQLLSIEVWEWRGDFLAMQTAPRREQLRAAAPDGPVAPALAAFLRGAVTERLQRLPSAPADAAPPVQARPSWLRRVKLPWTR